MEGFDLSALSNSAHCVPIRAPTVREGFDLNALSNSAHCAAIRAPNRVPSRAPTMKLSEERA
ncbi:MAG: hypothetical protein CHACPFDD_03028 [Phycisphaerae bacterium]|nr:hypothetical protein [Phycisphaerae bacterium]